MPAPARGVPSRVLLALVLLGAPAAVLLATTPNAGAQSQDVRIASIDTNPQALPREGGTLRVDLTLNTQIPDVELELNLIPPGQSQPAVTQTGHLVATSPGTIDGHLEALVPQDGITGWWTARIGQAWNATGDDRQPVPLEGATQTHFYLHPNEPVAGTTRTPWVQPGGDAQHSARSLAAGPDRAPVARWDTPITSQDGSPFHQPVINADQAIFTVTWSGDVYRFSTDGGAAWSQPFPLASAVAHPPALGPTGNVLVATQEGALHAIDPDRGRVWETPLEGDAPTALSSPIVGPNDRIYLMQSPWSVAILEPDGALVDTIPIDAPQGFPPTIPDDPATLHGPGLAVARDGTIVALTQGGLQTIAPNGTLEAAIECGCSPRAVSLIPGVQRALIAGEDDVVAVSLTNGGILWRTATSNQAEANEVPGTNMEGTPWSPPAVGWSQGPGHPTPVYMASEGGLVRAITMQGVETWSEFDFEGDRQSFPIRGQPVVDAAGNVYVADACQTLHSFSANGQIHWTKTISTNQCQGLNAGPVLTRAGSIVWASPDGQLRMFGTNRLPDASFETGWVGGQFELDATASQDPDGNPLTYSWSLGDGSTAQGPVVRHTYPESGNYTIQLTVSDGVSTATTSRTVSINFPPDIRIIDESHEMRIRLNASATTDAEGQPLTFNWTVDNGPTTQGPILAFNASEPRVFDATLTVSDGTHTIQEHVDIVAPAQIAWTQATLTLSDGNCPASVCSRPPGLSLIEDGFAEVLVANVAGRSVHVTTAYDTVPGSPTSLTLGPGQQDTLYVKSDQEDQQGFQIRLVQGSPATNIPVSLRPAPGEITWTLNLPEDPPHAGDPAGIDLVLTGKPTPRPVQLDWTLRNGGATIEEGAVDLDAGEAINRTVELGWRPAAPGLYSLSFTLQPSDPQAARLQAAPGEPTTYTLEVQEPTLISSTARFFADHAWETGGILLALALAGAGAGTYAWWQRREETTSDTRFTPTPSPTSAPPGDDQTVAQGFMPRKVERFHVERVLGEGGFGKTYLANDTVLERDVVLKELEHVGQGQARDLLMHEAKTAANLTHPNVVVVHDVVEEDGRLLLVMEYVEGGTLNDYLDDVPIQPSQALHLLEAVLEGLSALHDAGIVHRDLKPTNILIAPDSTPKITDFGVAARIEDADSSTNGDGTFAGTPRWMAPEQLAGNAPGPQADVYAAGTILYLLLTGNHPLGLGNKTPPTEQLQTKTVQLPVTHLPAEINAVLAKALAQDPEDRYEDAKAFLDEVQALQAEPTPSKDAQNGPT